MLKRALLLVPVLMLACTPASESTPDAGTTPTDGGQVVAKGSVAVAVVTASGDPAAGAKVSLVGTTQSAVADARGEATFADLSAGAVLVQASAVGGVPVFGAAIVVAGETTQVSLALPTVVSTVVTPDAALSTLVAVGSGATLSLPPGGGLALASGAAYSGPVELRFALLGTDAAPLPPPPTEPGDGNVLPPVVAFDASAFASGGADAGAALQLATGQAIQFRRQLDAADPLVAQLGAPGKLELKRFDPTGGTWVTSGELTWDGSVLSGSLPHLSIYGGFSTAFYRFTYEVPSHCVKGTALKAGAPLAGVMVRYVFGIVVAGGVIDVDLRATSAADGSFCLPMPKAGATVAVKGWNAQATTPRDLTGSVIFRRFTIDRTFFAAPALPSTGDAACGAAATCTTLAPLDVAPVTALPPRCKADVSVCNDGNPCTDDTCNPADCPAGTSCSGCQWAARTGACDDGNSCSTGDTCQAGVCQGQARRGAAIAAGSATAPTLTKTSAAAQVPLADPFDAAPAEGGLFRANTQDMRLDYTGGRLKIFTASNGYWSLDLNGRSEISGPGKIAVGFVIPAGGVESPRLSLRLDGESGSIGVDLQRSGDPGQYVVSLQSSSQNVSDQDSSDPVTLATGVVHTLEYAATAAGEITATLTPNGGTPLAASLSTGVPGGRRFSLQVAGSVDGAGEKAVLELDALTSDFTIAVPERWTCTGSALEFEGYDYADAIEGPPNTVFFFGPGMSDPEIAVGQDYPATPVAFDGQAAAVQAYLISSQSGTRTVRLTLLSGRPQAEVEAMLSEAEMPLTIDARFDVFRRNADGTYTWSLATCPRATANGPAPTCRAAGPSACADTNACTRDSCDPVYCAFGTTCDGCRHELVTGLGLAPGSATPPALTVASAATRKTVNETCDSAAFDRDLVRMNTTSPRIDGGGGRLSYVQGAGQSSVQLYLALPGDSQTGFDGAGVFELKFVLPPVTDTFRNVNIGLRSQEGPSAGAQLTISSTGNALLDLSGSPAVGDFVPLAADVVHSLRIELTQAGELTATLTTAGGETAVRTVPFAATTGLYVDVTIAANQASGPAAEQTWFTLDSITSTWGLPVPATWTLTGSPLKIGSTLFDDELEGGTDPTVYWVGDDRRAIAAVSGTTSTPFTLPGDPAKVRVHALHLAADGQTRDVTVFSAASSEDVWEAMGRNASVRVAFDADAFTRTNGEYTWGLPACP